MSTRRSKEVGLPSTPSQELNLGELEGVSAAGIASTLSEIGTVMNFVSHNPSLQRDHEFRKTIAANLRG